MTKQDFVLIAGVIKAQRADLPTDDMTDHGLDQVAYAFANELNKLNPRFKAGVFLQACGVED